MKRGVAPTSPRPGRGIAGASSSDSSIHHSLALKHALRRFRATGGSSVLDLGPAVGRNVQFLSPFVSKLHIADLYHSIRGRTRRTVSDRVHLSRILRRDLPSPDQRPIDLVLAWDLLNYLTREQVAVLGQHLARLCRQDSLVLVLIATRKVIPDLPTRFLMIDAETLRYENDSRRERAAPGYTEADLERLMSTFEVETSFLLRHGIQEYVLTTRSVTGTGNSAGRP